MNYTELQVTTNFSFLRGASHPEEVIEHAATLGYKTIAITDNNSLAGIVRAYAAAKSAIIGFSKSVAAYYAKDNIRVNIIAPGLVETPMSLRAAADENILSFIKTKQPLDGGRIGQPEDLDGLAVYFMSDYSKFTTGQVVAVDGGWSISAGKS